MRMRSHVQLQVEPASRPVEKFVSSTTRSPPSHNTRTHLHLAPVTSHRFLPLPSPLPSLPTVAPVTSLVDAFTTSHKKYGVVPLRHLVGGLRPRPVLTSAVFPDVIHSTGVTVAPGLHGNGHQTPIVVHFTVQVVRKRKRKFNTIGSLVCLFSCFLR